MALRSFAVLKPGGRAAIVAWTDTERYELAVRLMGAITTVRLACRPGYAMTADA